MTGPIDLLHTDLAMEILWYSCRHFTDYVALDRENIIQDAGVNLKHFIGLPLSYLISQKDPRVGSLLTQLAA